MLLLSCLASKTSSRYPLRNASELGQYPYTPLTLVFGFSHTMQDGIPGTKRGLLSVVAVFVIFMQAGLWSARSKTQELFPDNSLGLKPRLLVDLVKGDAKSTVSEHPIPKLMADAELKFRDRLSRQSKTLAHAVSEYQKRFNRDPPRGFDDWWKFVQDNGVLMVDEYNAITEDLAPFWELSPAEFRLRASLVSVLHHE